MSVSVPLVVVIVSYAYDVESEVMDGAAVALRDEFLQEELLGDGVLRRDMVETVAAGTVTSLISTPVLVYTHMHSGVAVGT